MANAIISQEENPFFDKEVAPKSRFSKLINSLQLFVVFVFFLIFIYLFIATPNQVDGNSMFPTFHNREIVLTFRLVGVLGNTPFGKSIGLGYNHGDVIIFQKPGLKEFIKRVIGLPGDKIMIFNGHVYRNDVLLDEAYLGPTVLTNAGDFITEGTVVTVPDGSVAAFGDNRPGSYDSRFQGVGIVKMEWIKGRVLVRLWPANKFGIIQHANYVYTRDPADDNGPPAE